MGGFTAGWLEGGLTMGYEKFVLDADQAGAWHAFARGVDLSENGQALDAILGNGPGQHFLGSALGNDQPVGPRAPSTAGPPPRHSRLLSRLDLRDRARAVAFRMRRAGRSWYSSVAVAPGK